MGEGASIRARWADLVANHQQVNNISVAGIRRHLAGIPVAVFLLWISLLKPNGLGEHAICIVAHTACAGKREREEEEEEEEEEKQATKKGEQGECAMRWKRDAMHKLVAEFAPRAGRGGGEHDVGEMLAWLTGRPWCESLSLLLPAKASLLPRYRHARPQSGEVCGQTTTR
jgi:hypothetical protein